MSWDRSWSRSKLAKFRRNIHFAAQSLDDDDAIETVEMFPLWSGDGVQYEAGYRVRYADKLYKCVQSHASQVDWIPSDTPALWTEVAEPGAIPEWKQPTGAQDAYAKGDKVRHNDLVWISDVDNNVWEPGVYGWTIFNN